MPMVIRQTGLRFDQQLAQAMTSTDWRAVGEIARARIVERTRRGSPPEGEDWPAYSDAYRELKAKELGGGPVNLTVSGEMLNNLRVIDATAKSVTLGWAR